MRRKDKMRPGRIPRRKRGFRFSHFLIWILVIILTTAAVVMILDIVPEDDHDVDALLQETVKIEIHTEKEQLPETENEETEEVEEEKPEKPFNWKGKKVPEPEIDSQLLTINEFSRPGKKTKKIRYIVIHYLANPKTSAQENRDYFESLKNNLDEVSMSANYIVGIDGEIIECVPPGEIAYASNSLNNESISIENCHLDDSGRFTEASYQSNVELTAYLAVKYKIDKDHIIRHYDITGKDCPKYFVSHRDKWEEFKDDVFNYIEECSAE